MTQTTVQLDILSDPICPWCYIGKAHLDKAVPLESGTWADVTKVAVEDGALIVESDGNAVALAEPGQFEGYRDNSDGQPEILFKKNGLLIKLVIDPVRIIWPALSRSPRSRTISVSQFSDELIVWISAGPAHSSSNRSSAKIDSTDESRDCSP